MSYKNYNFRNHLYILPPLGLSTAVPNLVWISKLLAS